MISPTRLPCVLLAFSVVCGHVRAGAAGEPTYQIAVFSADVTIPLGHRCMGILPVKAMTIEDPLEARGFVLTGPNRPIVLTAVDWCEIRNGAYEAWRTALADAAGTTPQRVLVCSLHQHDAPVVDREAQGLLDEVGLHKELYDPAFQAACIRRVSAALRESLKTPRRVTHIGLGEAKVEKVASNRRLVLPDGRVTFNRYSASGGDPVSRDAPEGLIDPYLKTISFWDGDVPLLALHAYATHPMSHYGQGGVSADFVGLARRRRQADDPTVFQIYVTGCSGDVTAGKYNDGSPAMRPLLAERIYRAMTKAWEATQRHRLEKVGLQIVPLNLPFHESENFTRESLTHTLNNPDAEVRERILAAMGLSSRDRLDRGRPIDMPCVDFGAAQIVLFPGEAFVGYQLMAQRMRPDSFVLSIGYGECWTGYIPTKSAFDDGFNHGWRWVGRGCEQRIRTALGQVLKE